MSKLSWRIILPVLFFALSQSVAETIVDHDDYITAKCKSFSNGLSTQQINLYKSYMATQNHRFSHIMWHGFQNAYHALTADQKSLLLQIDSRFKPRAPYRDANGATITLAKDNSGGEDFLFMHRQMVMQTRSMYYMANLPCLASWKTTPPANDSVWPVPPGNNSTKSASTYQHMKNLEKKFFRNRAWLKRRSLSQVGYALSFSIHGIFHFRFNDQNKERSFGTRPALTLDNLDTFAKWDSPNYDLLWDTYSSAVNPHFWKLHGFVDETINEWLIANGKTSIALNCTGKGSACYQWKVATDSTRNIPAPCAPGEVESWEKIQRFAEANPSKVAAINEIATIFDRYSVDIEGNPNTVQLFHFTLGMAATSPPPLRRLVLCGIENGVGDIDFQTDILSRIIANPASITCLCPKGCTCTNDATAGPICK